MTFEGQGKMALEDALVHYGVKGMKWGQRKTYSTTDILAARKRQNTLAVQARGLRRTPERRAAAQAHLNSPDRAIAARTTTGEKTVITLVHGPIGLLAVTALGVNAHLIERSRTKASR